MAMTITEYQALPPRRQAFQILKEGIMLNSRIHGIKEFILFKLDTFYVEIEYSNLQRKITNLFSFCSGEYLEQYEDK
jgi:hypothetical protein